MLDKILTWRLLRSYGEKGFIWINWVPYATTTLHIWRMIVFTLTTILAFTSSQIVS